MTEAIGYSSMLVRIGQQLCLDKLEFIPKNETLIILWNYLLYLEGSASVVYGFPFTTSKKLLSSSVRQLSLKFRRSKFKSIIPYEFSAGRFKINEFFYYILKEYENESTNSNEQHSMLSKLNEDIHTTLYLDIQKLKSHLRKTESKDGEYFASTLNIFLYRLHLRYYALVSSLQIPSNLNFSFSEQKDNNDDDRKDITWILNAKQQFSKEAVSYTHLDVYKRQRVLFPLVKKV